MAAQQQDDDELIAGINITPMVDIMLVLLIIFMVTTSVMQRQAIKIELPKAATGETAETSPLGLHIDVDRKWFLNGEPTDENGVRAFIRAEKDGDVELQALVSADKSVPHGDVVHVIDVVKQEGVYKFAINIDPVPPPVGVPVEGSP